MQADHHDDETLQPHADQNDRGKQKQCKWTGSEFTDPQQLRDKDVARQQRVITGGVGPVQPVPKSERVVAVAAIPAHERFNCIAVGDDESGRQHYFC